MYKKCKKFTKRAYDNKLGLICDRLIDQNSDAFFTISKKFVVKPDNTLGDEIKGVPVIISSVEIDKLVIPSTYHLNKGFLSNWCDEEPLVKLIYSPMRFIDGDVNGVSISNLFLDFECFDDIQKTLNYK